MNGVIESKGKSVSHISLACGYYRADGSPCHQGGARIVSATCTGCGASSTVPTCPTDVDLLLEKRIRCQRCYWGVMAITGTL